jgi:hypothetical protein
MENFTPALLQTYAIVLIYSVLMVTAAWDKLKTFGVAPDWFIGQFAKTPIASIPGGAKIGYAVITLLETALAVMFVLSPFMPALLPWALTGSLFLFGILCLGLRLASEFQGSANMFVYFGATLLSLFVMR